MKKQSVLHSILRKLSSVDPSIIPMLIEFAKSIGLNIKVAVLTGGPCAGKTDSLIHLEAEFIKRGYQVILLPEAATIIRNQGFRAEQGVYVNDACQRLMILQNETSLINAIIVAIESHVEGTNRKLLIVRDRSSLDGAAYVESTAVFEASLIDMNISMSHICYCDVVIFLRSLAFDRISLYKKFSLNNSARFETPDQAGEADQKLLNVYQKYSHPHVIDNKFKDFDEKLDRVVDTIVEALGEPRLEKELAFIIKGDAKTLFNLGFDESSSVDIYQFYMSDGTRYRRIMYPGSMHSSYIRTVKIDTEKMDCRMETESIVTASEFVWAEAHMSTEHKPIFKTRLFQCVKISDSYFIMEADMFSRGIPWNNIRVEVEYGLEKPDIAHLFKGLEYVDVTGRKDCSNNSIALGTFPTHLFT